MTSDDVRVSDQQALVVELMQALESGAHGDELRRFFHEDAEQIEYPSLVDPRVGRRDLDSMITASATSATLIAPYAIGTWKFTGPISAPPSTYHIFPKLSCADHHWPPGVSISSRMTSPFGVRRSRNGL